MSPKQSVKTILQFCEVHANPAIVTKYQRYFKEGYDAFGVDGEVLGAAFKEWLASGLIPSDKKEAFDLCELLYSDGKYELGALAVWTLKQHLDTTTASDLKQIRAWLDSHFRNWAHTDVLCSEVLGPLNRSGIASLKAFSLWIKSPSRWTRRAVPVTLISALKRDPSSIPELLKCVAPLSHDPERVVHQGMGWFLRECWKKDAPNTEAFLLEIKDTAPRLMIQYATEKMPKASKARFKRSA